MTKVIGGMTISLDGFVNDRNGSVEHLYPDLDALLDELSVYIRPVLLGDGLRLFAQHDATLVEMEIVEVSESAGSVYARLDLVREEE